MARFIVSLILAISFLTSCSSLTKAREQNLPLVHVGQSKAQLLDVLGKPDVIEVKGSVEKWYYEIFSADNRRIYPYTASFENGNLNQWVFDTARDSGSHATGPSGRVPSASYRY